MPTTRVSFALLIGILLAAAGSAKSQDQGGADRVDELLSEMTLEEKVGQMTQLAIDAVSSTPQTDSSDHDLDLVKLREALVDHHVGSILNVYGGAYSLEHWQEVIATIQDVALHETRLAVPVIYGIDAVHGHNYLQEGTIFPQNLAMAATWNPDLVRSANRVTAEEMRASGIPWNFAPVLDIGRQPLWSRFFETFGEDVLMVETMGRATVEGLQGQSVGDRGRVAACLKHFLGYSLPRSGKDRTPAWIPERMLREYVLPPFQQAIEAGAKTIMVNSSEVNGVPVHASKEILTDLLRDELGFDGVVVTDWEDIRRLETVHKIAASNKEAVKLAVDAGIDISMVPYDYSFYDDLLELVREGSISESRIDESVRRILQLKVDLGLFENPYHDETLVDSVGTAANHRLSLEAARESITLLKNENDVLPLKQDERILVAGFGAASLSAFHGSWTYTWQGRDEVMYPDSALTVVDVLVNRAGIEKVTYVPGTTASEEISISAAVEEAFRADKAVIVVAESPSTEKPGDIEDLELSPVQQQLVSAVSATGTPIILVIVENRPRIVREIEPLASGILLAYQTGPFGPEALVDILYGSTNPSGRLPFTYPRYSGSVVPYDHTNAEEIGPTSDPAFNPQWRFGEGLSYTEYAYSGLRLEDDTLSADGVLHLSIDVSNMGEMDGMEVVQVYVSDLVASITPPVSRLRAFRKVDLAAGQTQTISFEIPVSDLAFIGIQNLPVTEPGDFTVSVGGESASFVVE